MVRIRKRMEFEALLRQLSSYTKIGLCPLNKIITIPVTTSDIECAPPMELIITWVGGIMSKALTVLATPKSAWLRWS